MLVATDFSHRSAPPLDRGLMLGTEALERVALLYVLNEELPSTDARTDIARRELEALWTRASRR